MNGKRGRKSTPTLEAVLGALVPPGRVAPGQILSGLVEVMESRRYFAGHGVPSVPTRYVVGLHPADRAAFTPLIEERLARALTNYAERSGFLIVGDLTVELEPDHDTVHGRPVFWAGFSDDDLLVLSSPRAAASVFAGR
ncbi:MAG: FhaA domain-containing protein [Actinomycetota bacterium]